MPYSDGIYTPPPGSEDAAPGDVIRSATWNATFTDLSGALTDVGALSIEFVMDGGGQPVATGLRGFLEIPFPCTINSWKIMANQVGSCQISIWKAPFASFPPNSGQSIVGGTPPKIISAQSNSSSTLTGWTTSISAGDVLAFNLDSLSAITLLTISLDVGRN